MIITIPTAEQRLKTITIEIPDMLCDGKKFLSNYHATPKKRFHALAGIEAQSCNQTDNKRNDCQRGKYCALSSQPVRKHKAKDKTCRNRSERKRIMDHILITTD